jgi:hypothetical protein
VLRDNAAVKAVQDKLKLENDAKAAAAEYAARQAELLAVAAAKAAADAASTAATARSNALDAAAKSLSDVATSSGNYAEAAAAAAGSLQEANRQSDAGSAAAALAQAVAVQAQATADRALAVQVAAEEAAAAAVVAAAAAAKAASDAAAARAAAAAANQAKPVTDKQYSLLVAAARREAEDAAIKKAAEEKAKADAQEAAAAAEKAAANTVQAETEAARKKADDAKAEADRLAAKAAEDIAAADAKANAAIDAAKKKAQQIIDKIKENLNKLAASAAQSAAKYRDKEKQSSAKADSATQAMNDAKDKASRTAEIANAAAVELKTATNQVINYQNQQEVLVSQEKTIKVTINTTIEKLNSSINDFEKSRIEIASYVATYNSAKTEADIATRDAAIKKEAALRSAVIADNAVAAYKTAAGIKTLISTQKPFTINNVEVGADLQTAISAADIAKLKKLADQAVARHKQDQKDADIAAKRAEKALADFQRIKSVLEGKVAATKLLQEKIRAMQDQLATHRQSLASAVIAKNELAKRVRSSQSIVAAKLNELTITQVEAQKAKVIADSAILTVTKYRNDASNADKVATANEAAIEAAKRAALDVTESSNSLDKIVASKVVADSIASIPVIFSIAAVVVAASFFATLAMRRLRRRSKRSTPRFEESDADIQFDFDRILAEIRASESNQKLMGTTKVATKAKTVKKPLSKKSSKDN